MAAEEKLVWVEATQLDSEGQAFSNTMEFEVLLQDHCLTLTKKTLEGITGGAIDVQTRSGAVPPYTWSDPVTQDTVNGKLIIPPGVHRISCHISGGTANQQGEFYGEFSVLCMPYDELA